MSILAGVATPSVSDYVEQAAATRARHDVRILAVTLVRLFSDVGPATARQPGGWATYELLVGAGSEPAAAAGSLLWATPAGHPSVDRVESHLVTNAARYPRRNQEQRTGWRGPYLDDLVRPDPWGHRYAVNVGAMTPAATDTMVLSAGPNGIAECVSSADGLPACGDDFTSVVASGVNE